MKKALIEKHLTNLLSVHSPVKARKLAKILADEFGQHVDRSDINSTLYAMKSQGLASMNDKYEWSLLRDNSEETIPHDKPEQAEPVIHFTPEQQAIIDLDPTQHLLIRGQAGSGKTTVLAARAGKIISAMNMGSVLFLTYNAALCAYVAKAFDKAGMKGSIDVRTFHDWAKSTSISLGATFEGWVTTRSRLEKLREIIAEASENTGSHRLYELADNTALGSWWSDEIAWLFGQHITRLGEYLTVDRVGRGTAVRLLKEERYLVWFVYEAYCEWLEETRQEDYDNPAGLILRTLTETGQSLLPESLRYDHLMIDEVQDFDRSWLLAAVKIPRISLSLAGDLAQKIYKRSFSWASVGIQVQGGRSRRLAASHRTTCQIMDVAEYLLHGNSVVNDDNYTAPVSPVKQGEKVLRIVTDNPKSAYEAGYDWIAENYKRLRTTSVAVVLPFSKQLYPASKALEKRGLSAKSVKGAGLGKFSGGVVVTTFHQLKGLEFDHVVIMGLHDSQYPGRLLDNVAKEDQAEELNLMKRILYVAMTRARKSVTLVGAKPFCRLFSDVPENLFEGGESNDHLKDLLARSEEMANNLIKSGLTK